VNGTVVSTSPLVPSTSTTAWFVPRATVSGQLREPEPGGASDHLRSLVDAELAWLDRAIDRCNRRHEHSAGGPQID
jgi:hypothetical protein